MVSGFISRLVILVFGTLYPAYASYKAVRTKNVKEYVKWMMYWIVFALFTCAETFTDLFLSFWFPFYYEIKIITVIYLLSPATKGSSILYRKFVHPVLTKREQEIDEYIAKAKEQGYHTMLNLGSRGVNYATSLIMQTAIKGLPNLPLTPSSDFLPAKIPEAVDPFDLEDDYNSLKDWAENSLGQGGGGLVNQLRKSYSLSDLREEENETVTDGGGSRLIRRNMEQILPGENRRGFCYPDDDFYQQPFDGDREVLYSDLNSAYSNGDPLNFSMKPSKGDVLVRTASLGPSSRIRTRAVTKNGLPKRASLSEGGSTRSPVEPRESQNEANNLNTFLTHSTSYPLVSFPPYFTPEHQHLFNNVIHNQTFAFITHPQLYAHALNDRTVSLHNSFQGELPCPSEGTPENDSEFISEENSNVDNEVTSKGALNAAGEIEIDCNENASVNQASEKDKEKDEKLTETKTVEQVKTTKENLTPPLDDALYGEEKPFQKRSGKYKKKPAPTPPTEQSVSKSTSSLTAEEEESEFFTPNASPKPSRKPSLFDLDVLPVKNNTESDDKCKTQPSTRTAESQKKSKTKKGDTNISKKLNIPKVSFSFWHQKPGKSFPSPDTCSIASIENASTRSEKTQSATEIFIPLKDPDENKDEESKAKEDPHLING